MTKLLQRLRPLLRHNLYSQQLNAGIPDGIKKWLYLTGSGVAISGSAKGGRLNSDTQTQIGIAIILATFIIDILWKIA